MILHKDDSAFVPPWEQAPAVSLDMSPFQRVVWGIVGSVVTVLCMAAGYVIDHPDARDGDVLGALEQLADTMARPRNVVQLATTTAMECPK